jgi:hypothetical protein
MVVPSGTTILHSSDGITMKFWLTLILGTIAISAGLTFLNLYKGAQTISYPPPAKPEKSAQIEFIEVPQPIKEAKTVISANAVSIDIPDTRVGVRNECHIRFKSTGEAPLHLTFESTASGLEIYIEDRRITGTDPHFELPPGREANLKLVWTPTRDQVSNDDKPRTRGVVRFAHNDQRFTDELIFEARAKVSK